MATAGDRKRLRRLLGGLSLGLGAGQLLAPAAVNQLIGVRATAGANAVMRAVGWQELAMAAGLLARPRPGLAWARVAGDLLHLALLAGAAGSPGNHPRRIAAAASTVTGLALLDVAATRAGGRPAREPLPARARITVNRPPDQVYRHWRDLEQLPRFMHHLESVRALDARRTHWVARAPAGRRLEWLAEIVEDRPGEVISWRSVPGARVPNHGEVRFQPAPAGTGTEVTVDLRYQLPGGRLGKAVATLFGEAPGQQVKDDLRRFKQVVETGEVVRSDGTPEGTLTHRQLRQRPAQPAKPAGRSRRGRRTVVVAR